MFCPECGSQVSDNASFCRTCGTSLGEEGAAPPQPVAEQPMPQQAAPPPVMTQQQPVAAQQIARRPMSAMPGVQPAIGIVVIIGAALAAIGSFLPWLDSGGYTANGFDGGYITGSSMGDGNDGIIILLLGLAAGALAIHYFRIKNPLLSLGSLVLGAAAAGVAGYNFIKLYKDINDAGLSPADFISYGLFVSIVGGAIAAAASFIGLKREGTT